MHMKNSSVSRHKKGFLGVPLWKQAVAFSAFTFLGIALLVAVKVPPTSIIIKKVFG
ncbi:MAG: hypothetical protein JWM20_234 [Patescibacteria group bacterium]|nr:hypothetical protein [Patescibacteria group bacterium]